MTLYDPAESMLYRALAAIANGAICSALTVYAQNQQAKAQADQARAQAERHAKLQGLLAATGRAP